MVSTTATTTTRKIVNAFVCHPSKSVLHKGCCRVIFFFPFHLLFIVVTVAIYISTSRVRGGGRKGKIGRFTKEALKDCQDVFHTQKTYYTTKTVEKAHKTDRRSSRHRRPTKGFLRIEDGRRVFWK